MSGHSTAMRYRVGHPDLIALVGPHRPVGFVQESSMQAYEQRTSAVWLASLIVVLIAVFFTGPNYIRSIRSGTELTLKDWGYSAAWLESAECARTTGVPLIGCHDNKRVSYAEIAPSDDPGHALFLGIYAMARGKQLGPHHIHVLNTTVNYAGLLMLAGCCCLLNCASPARYCLSSALLPQTNSTS